MCQGAIGSTTEICDGRDNDCDGTDDEGNPGGGVSCGSSTGICTRGTSLCSGGMLICSGGTPPGTESCDGTDEDCELADGIHFKLREGMNDWGGDPPAAAWSTDGVKGVDAVVLSPGDGGNLAEGRCAKTQKIEAIEAPWIDGDPYENSVYWGVFVGDLDSGDVLVPAEDEDPGLDNSPQQDTPRL